MCCESSLGTISDTQNVPTIPPTYHSYHTYQLPEGIAKEKTNPMYLYKMRSNSTYFLYIYLLHQGGSDYLRLTLHKIPLSTTLHQGLSQPSSCV